MLEDNRCNLTAVLSLVLSAAQQQGLAIAMRACRHIRTLAVWVVQMRAHAIYRRGLRALSARKPLAKWLVIGARTCSWLWCACFTYLGVMLAGSLARTWLQAPAEGVALLCIRQGLAAELSRLARGAAAGRPDQLAQHLYFREQVGGTRWHGPWARSSPLCTQQKSKGSCLYFEAIAVCWVEWNGWVEVGC